jgi:hypothetical protein
MRMDWRTYALTGGLILCASAIGAQTPSTPSPTTGPVVRFGAETPALPANLKADSTLRSILTWLWCRSPTFRRQCLRIAAARNLTVVLSVPEERPGPHVNALTTCVRDRSGRLIRAEIRLTRILDLRQTFDLIAHEIEHTIEQLDALDLPTLAHRGVAGVHAHGKDLFETARAVAIGALVAREAQENAAARADAESEAHGSSRSGT